MSSASFDHLMIRASAGSGKTYQLTNRYLGLLAHGVLPDAILATTFTRKAAGEILDRVLQRLAEAAGDAKAATELAGQLRFTKGDQPDFVALLRHLVRNLHRMRIATLDSFYIALAGSFSLELGLPPGWAICEEMESAALRQEALERLLDRQPDDIAQLFPLLSKGETKRSVHGELDEVIGKHYETFRSSPQSAWECLRTPEPAADAACLAALDALRDFDFSTCGHKGFFTTRDKDVAHFDQEDWLAFVGNGMAKKLAARDVTFQKKPIPGEVQAYYTTLLQHATSKVLRSLDEQTRATWDLLRRFHGELRALQQVTGDLRFDDVTVALVDGLRQNTLQADALAFRLDGTVDHLLLDEFQDTSQGQWQVLRPMAEHITNSKSKSSRSFFCVGDIKQAIYGWRGGLAEVFGTLQDSLGPLQEEDLDKSWRSAQPVIDVVNQVFGNLGESESADKHRAAFDAWGCRFQSHVTHKTSLPGHVTLCSGPEQTAGEALEDVRKRHYAYVATKIRDLQQQTPGCSIGVLCRNNKPVARLIYDLRRLGVDASEEGGNPLTDSPAVEVILSLFMLADHPGHSIARFHVKNSPLQEQLHEFPDADALSQLLRRELLTHGYGAFVKHWAELLAPACNRRDLSRLQQLLEMAYEFQPRSTLRADDFVAWVRQQKKPDPTGADVRVMTIHGAKGLEFDVVFLPELDINLLGRAPAFVVDRDAKSLDVSFVCRYANQATQELLEPDQRGAFEEDRRRRAEESLSLLYVAMTRAIHALHLVVPGPRLKKQNDAWFNLLEQTLAPGLEVAPRAPLYERGDAQWFQKIGSKSASAVIPPAAQPDAITFKQEDVHRRRGLEHVAPSRREGNARVPLDRLFKPSEGTGMAAGTLYHAWFESIDWLDDGAPTEDVLRKAAAKLRMDLPAETWRDLDRLMAVFTTWLQNPVLSGVLRRSAYASPQHPGFPPALALLWTKAFGPQRVEKERRFLVRDDASFLNGSFDRIVWLGDGERIVAADVLDFKTDALKRGDAKAVSERTEHYRPQLESYRRAVALMAHLPEACVATRLVFTFGGAVVDVRGGT